jgi:hypothetical protein
MPSMAPFRMLISPDYKRGMSGSLIDGQVDPANKRTTDFFGIQDAQHESGPGDEEFDDVERAS